MTNVKKIMHHKKLLTYPMDPLRMNADHLANQDEVLANCQLNSD